MCFRGASLNRHNRYDSVYKTNAVFLHRLYFAHNNPLFSMHQRCFLSIILLFSVTTSICKVAAAISRDISPSKARRIAVEAYIYGYSLVTSEVTRVQMTNSSDPATNSTPMGEFNNLRTYPPASYHGVVAPNADTLYSIAWIDLNKQPWFFTHPNMDGRYYLFPIYDLWTSELYDPGARTAGTNASTYALVGPRWNWRLPNKVLQYVTKVVRSSTRFIFILGRTYCTGTTADYSIVNQLQDQYLLRPMNVFVRDQNVTYSAPNTTAEERYPDPPFNQTGAVRDVINNMDVSTYFNMMAARMKVMPRSVYNETLFEKNTSSNFFFFVGKSTTHERLSNFI